MVNPTKDEFKKEYEKVVAELKKAHKDCIVRPLLMTYYAGHGVMDTNTQIAFNEVEDEDRFFKLEFDLFTKSKYKNNFIVLILDCCRERKEQPLMRGGAADSDHLKANFICTYGCPPQ